MTIEQTKNGTGLLMTIAGRLDTTTAPQLAEAFDEIGEDVLSLTLDFKGLEYISSAGLRVLLQMQKVMSKREGLALRGVNETVMEVFEVTGFVDILTIED